MKVLLLGAGGFIGSALTEKIAADDTNSIIAYGRSVVPGQYKRGNITYIRDEFRNINEHLPFPGDCDVIIHSVSSLLPVSDNFNDEMRNVITPTISLLEHFKNSKKHFVFLSSGGAVYELNSREKLREDMPLKAYNFYGLSKIMLENIFLFYRERYGTRVTVLRPSNVFGYRSNNIGLNGIISTLINNCVSRTTTDIWGTGEAIRDYIHIDDFTDIVYKVAQKNLTGIYNVSSNNAKSVNEIIDIINRYSPDKCNINYKENLYQLPGCIILDNEKITRTLSTGPQRGFEEQISELVTKYYAGRKKTASF